MFIFTVFSNSSVQCVFILKELSVMYSLFIFKAPSNIYVQHIYFPQYCLTVMYSMFIFTVFSNICVQDVSKYYLICMYSVFIFQVLSQVYSIFIFRVLSYLCTG